MKNKGKLFVIIALAAVIGFSMAACTEDGEIATMSGDITISASGEDIAAGTVIAVGTEITATYNGPEKVSTYEWKKDLGTVSLGSSNKYTPTEAGTYTVIVNATGYLPSKPSIPFLVAKILTGTITINPTDDVITGTELTATYSGTESVKYQWKKGLILSTDITGATTNKYKPTEMGYYTVTVSAEGFISKSSEYVFVSTPTTPDLTGNITISPTTGVTTGKEITATYDGTETVSFQWKKGSAIVGTTNKFTPTETGFYTVTVSAEGFKSKSAFVSVSAPETPDLTGDIDIKIETVSGKQEITATYKGTETVSYQWKKGATDIQGATSAKFTPTETGYYTVIVSAAGYRSKASNGYLITVVN